MPACCGYLVDNLSGSTGQVIYFVSIEPRMNPGRLLGNELPWQIQTRLLNIPADKITGVSSSLKGSGPGN